MLKKITPFLFFCFFSLSSLTAQKAPVCIHKQGHMHEWNDQQKREEYEEIIRPINKSLYKLILRAKKDSGNSVYQPYIEALSELRNDLIKDRGLQEIDEKFPWKNIEGFTTK